MGDYESGKGPVKNIWSASRSNDKRLGKQCRQQKAARTWSWTGQQPSIYKVVKGCWPRRGLKISDGNQQPASEVLLLTAGAKTSLHAQSCMLTKQQLACTKCNEMKDSVQDTLFPIRTPPLDFPHLGEKSKRGAQARKASTTLATLTLVCIRAWL